MQILMKLLSLQRVTYISIPGRWGLIAAMMVLTMGMRAPLQNSPQSRANQVKAVFLYNFTQFIGWPASSFDDSQSPFVIGVLGQNTFGSYLSEVVENEKVNNRPIIIKYFNNITPEVGDCEILFIDKTFPAIKQVIQSTHGKPVLTVSDHEHFTKQAGILRFYLDDGKLRIEINQEASAGSGLEVSAKLLRIATIYKQD
jgi:hypothetical protein